MGGGGLALLAGACQLASNYGLLFRKTSCDSNKCQCALDNQKCANVLRISNPIFSKRP